MSALGKEFKRRGSILANAIRMMGERKDGSPNTKVLAATAIVLALAICGMILTGCAGSKEQPKKAAAEQQQKFKGTEVPLNTGDGYQADLRRQTLIESDNPGVFAEAWTHSEFSDGWELSEYEALRAKWQTAEVPAKYEQLLRERGLIGRDASSSLMESHSTDVWIDAEIAEHDPTAKPWVAKLNGADDMHLVRVMSTIDLGSPTGQTDEPYYEGQMDLEAIVYCPDKSSHGCKVVNSTYAEIHDGLNPVPTDRRTALFSQSLSSWKG